MPSSLSALSHLKFRHLQLVLYLVELGTLHKAARALNVSQPAASAMLNDLEETMGMRFFERGHRGVRLTEAGAEVLDPVRTLLNEFAHLAGTVERLGHGRERLLRIGVVPQAFAAYLPQAISRFRAARGCALKTEEGTARHLLRLLWEGQLDCVIGRLPSTGIPEGIEPGALRFDILYTETICVACGAGVEHKVKRPGYAWLAEQEWVLQRRDSSVRQSLNESFLRHGVQPPRPVVETTNYMQSLALVARSHFYTVAPRHAAELQRRSGAVQILDLDLEVAPMQVSFITRATSGDNEQLRRFREAFAGVTAEA